VQDGRRFDQVAVHPYSGVATLSRDSDRVLVERDGVIAFDSTEPRTPAPHAGPCPEFCGGERC